MSYHSDPTANRALGAVSKEWNQMVRLAERIKKNPNSEWADQQRRRFTGIYKRLLDDDTSQPAVK